VPTATANWSAVSADALIDPGTTQLRLIMAVASTRGGPAGRAEFRGIDLQPLSPVIVRLSPEMRNPVAPVAVWSSGGAGRYLVRTGAVHDRVVLTLAESYAAGWQVTGLPPGWTARHIVVDGYANGWILTGRGQASLALDYGPNRYQRVATAVSVLGIALVVFWPTLRRIRHIAKRRLDAAFAGREHT
jgi:arabinofuranan 3-O-arabinosyltransferase